MALGADLHANVRSSRAGVNDLTAGARDGRVDIVWVNTHLHDPTSLERPSGYQMMGSLERSRPWTLAHRVHGGQELAVGLGQLELIEQEFHGLDRIELGERLAEQPHLLQLVLLEEQLLLSRARLLDVDGGEHPLVHETAVEMDLHVAGALELF